MKLFHFKDNYSCKLACTIVQGTIVVTLMLASTWVSHFKVLRQSFFKLWARHCQVSYLVWGQVLLFQLSQVLEFLWYMYFISVLLPPLPFQKREVQALRKEFSAGTFSDHMVLLRAFQVICLE